MPHEKLADAPSKDANASSTRVEQSGLKFSSGFPKVS